MKDNIRKILEKVLKDLKYEIKEVQVDYVKNEKFGDYSTNVAMILAKDLKRNPMEIAKEISEKIKDEKNIFEKVEAVNPGYINFYLSKKYFQEKVREINKLGENFGNSEAEKGVKVNNEFISANPTGPLHLGNGRGGFLGDVISKVLKKNGYDVTNEYYVNDAGEQVMKLGHSVLKDSEAVYAGEYIDELNEKFKALKDVKVVGEKAAKIVMDKFVKKTATEKMQINFDVWQSEKELYDKGYVEKAIEKLKKDGLTFEEEGALWLRTTDFGDDKNRVLVKKDGQFTYFASDCGYILSKMEREFEKIIEIWGADHHGYIGRFQATAKALGFQGEVKLIIVQLVRLMKDGQEFRMSKRAGNVVYIDDLLDEVGLDVARFFFLMYSANTHMNFDLGLAKERSQKNPVYYIQYANARICSILKKEENDGQKPDLSLLIHKKELNLIRELDKFPDLVLEISKSYEVHRLPHYAIGLADKLHSFYNSCKVIDTENQKLSTARLELIKSVKVVLGETFRLMGISAPEEM